MDVQGLIKGTAATPDNNTGKPQGSNELGKNEFVKLLMAQMSNQDPTAPSDSQAFVAQLATFAQLELQQTSNASLDNLLLAQASANQTAMANYVGRDVSFKTDTLHLKDSQIATGMADLADDATNVTATITDSNGKPVRSMQLGAHHAGSLSLTWDGRDDFGNRAAAGDYKLSVTASDANKKSVAVSQTAVGHVTGLAFTDGVAMLKLGDDLKIKVSDIAEINERTNP